MFVSPELGLRLIQATCSALYWKHVLYHHFDCPRGDRRLPGCSTRWCALLRMERSVVLRMAAVQQVSNESTYQTIVIFLINHAALPARRRFSAPGPASKPWATSGSAAL